MPDTQEALKAARDALQSPMANAPFNRESIIARALLAQSAEVERLREALLELRISVFELGPHWAEPAKDHYAKWMRLNNAQHSAGILLFGPDDPHAGPELGAALSGREKA